MSTGGILRKISFSWMQSALLTSPNPPEVTHIVPFTLLVVNVGFPSILGALVKFYHHCVKLEVVFGFTSVDELCLGRAVILRSHSGLQVISDTGDASHLRVWW